MKDVLLTGVAMVVIAAGAPAVASSPVTGVWQTPPDRKDLVSHIRVAHCGDDGKALCGKVLRAYNSDGELVETPNIGKRIFWGVEPLGDGEYGNGTAWVPLLNVNASANLTLSDSGDTLKVRGCKAILCDSQMWRRVK